MLSYSLQRRAPNLHITRDVGRDGDAKGVGLAAYKPAVVCLRTEALIMNRLATGNRSLFRQVIHNRRSYNKSSVKTRI
jgi:hypothetical protein